MKWYTRYLSVYNLPFDETPKEISNRIKEKIEQVQSDKPLVTISVIAYNEERHLLSCLWSLSDLQCRYPIEIIGVDNASKDRTAEIFRAVGIPYYTEHQHSCGFARQCGLMHAKGKYHINIDSDTLYPPRYVETMVEALAKREVVAACASWSYIPDKEHTTLALKIYESTRDFFLFLQSFKRPELSVRGLVFAYHTELAKKVGIRTDIIRGEDGSLALGLKQYGRIKFIRSRKARAITGYGTVSADGSFLLSFLKRALKGIRNIPSLFYTKREYKDKDSNLIK